MDYKAIVHGWEETTGKIDLKKITQIAAQRNKESITYKREVKRYGGESLRMRKKNGKETKIKDMSRLNQL